MAGRFPHTVVRQRAQRRETMWIELGTVASTLAGAPTAVLASSLNAAGLALRPFTVVRVRGWLECHSDQAAASESYLGDFAMAVVSDQAVAVGVTAVPTPLTDKGSDLFFVYEQLGSRTFFGDATGVREVGVQKYFDSKVMRKVNDDQDIIAVVENEIAGCVVTFSGRILIKLH